MLLDGETKKLFYVHEAGGGRLFFTITKQDWLWRLPKLLSQSRQADKQSRQSDERSRQASEPSSRLQLGPTNRLASTVGANQQTGVYSWGQPKMLFTPNVSFRHPYSNADPSELTNL